MRSWVHCPYKTMSTSSKWLKHQLAPSVAQRTPLLDTWVRKSRCLSFTSPRLWCLLNLICYYCMCIYEYGVSRDTHLPWHMGEGQRASFRSLYSWLRIRCDEFCHLEFPAVPCDCELKCAFLCWATWASGNNGMTRGSWNQSPWMSRTILLGIGVLSSTFHVTATVTTVPTTLLSLLVSLAAA